MHSGDPPFVTIVVPVLGDEQGLCAVLAHLAPEPGSAFEVLVAGTAGEAGELEAACRAWPAVQVVMAPRGRGAQMNAASRHARGRWLLFLHADTRLDRDWLGEVGRAARHADYVCGCFRFALDADALTARLIVFGARQRTRWLGLPYGDQAIFVRRDVFERIGGYREWPLLEDVDLVERLRAHGRLWRSALAATTSARRWIRSGWFRSTARNYLVMALHWAGVSPARLARLYYGRREAVVGILARDPAGGKTRLRRALRLAEHDDLPARLLLDTLDAVGSARGMDSVVCVTPPAGVQAVRRLLPGTPLIAQRGDDLGDRMHAASGDLLALGYRAVLLIGSDLPALPPSFLEAAARLLRRRRCEVVLGPAEDGGYYLIGMRRPCAGLFAGIEWGQPDVLERTLEAARRQGLSVRLLPTWYDVDSPADLMRLMGVRDRRAAPARRTTAWVSARGGEVRGSAVDRATPWIDAAGGRGRVLSGEGS